MADTSLVIAALVGHHDNGARFCFFCPTSFLTDIALSDHVKYQHTKEIRKLSQNKLDILCFHSCPFCNARFYKKSLLPQHLIQDHCNLFSQLFQTNANEHINCPFCDYKILAVFENLLAHHVDECHMVELEEYLTANHSVTMQSEKFLMSFCLEPETPVLSDKFAQLTTKNQTKPNKPQGNAKRKLFSVSDSKENKGNIKPILKSANLEQTPKTTFCWRPSAKGSRTSKQPQVRFTTSTPKSHAPQQSPKCATGDYRCGSCRLYFGTNSDLALHVRQRHSALKALLHPLYGCGECQAAFFKNSFIKRHRKFHHTYIES